MQNDHAHTGVSIKKHIADKAAALLKAAEQNSSRTYIAVTPGQRMNSGGRSSGNTSCPPEAAPGTTVGAGEPGGTRGGKA